MATDEKPTRRFDSFGLRPSSAVPARSEPRNAPPIEFPQAERLAVIQGLGDLGYQPAQIELILGGPSMTSIEGLSGRVIRAKSLPKEPDANRPLVVNEPVPGDVQIDRTPPSTSPPQQPLPSPPPPQEVSSGPVIDDRKFPRSVPVASYQLDIGQADIIEAVWNNLHGDPNGLKNLADNFEMLTKPLQAYLAAAVEAGSIFLVDLNQWVDAFNKAQAKSAKQRKDDDNQRKKTVGSIAGVAASAANLIPVVGQIIALAIAAGVAISEAILEAFPLPLREGIDQVHDSFEGLDAFWGLSIYYPERSDGNPPPARDVRYSEAKQAVVQDEVAFLLPVPKRLSRYKFTPNVDQFRRAAHELGLYAGEGNRAVDPLAEVVR